ncbi:MAG: C25 family cysteine peptidase [Dehalococcoidia bacterium]|nr:C25 family cysteine peptidase [Dehalococcoidia bacterium]
MSTMAPEGGPTNIQIATFIEDRYDHCLVRPSYVLLMSDAELIPPFYPAGLADNAGSDLPYATYDQVLPAPPFPFFAVGRIPVDTLNQANAVVNKIVQYESSPPFLGLLSGGLSILLPAKPPNSSAAR